MKKLLLLAVLLTACGTKPVHDRDFNFKYSFGVEDGRAENVLDSFHDSFTQDRVVDSPLTVTLELTDEEIQTVKDKIDELSLFKGEAPSDPSGITSISSPCFAYALEVKYGATGGAATEWNCENNQGNRALFVEFMNEFIQAQEEFQALPELNGGYM